MKVLNIHERPIPATSEEVAGMMNSLASECDALWPRSTWPPMRFDRPLAVGVRGGHGPIRYVVEEISPGRKLKFRFTSPRGFRGHHRFEVIPLGEHAALLRHIIDMRVHGLARLWWPLVFLPLHEALIEDLLARAQALAGAIPLISPWSRWVRLLRWVASGGRAREQEAPPSAAQPYLAGQGSVAPLY